MNCHLHPASRFWRSRYPFAAASSIKSTSRIFFVLGLLITVTQGPTLLQAQDTSPITIIDEGTNAPTDLNLNPTPSSETTGASTDAALNAPALFRQAVVLFSQNKLDDALVLVSKVLLINPNNGDACILRGAIYTDKKLWDQAEVDFQTALKLNPQSNTLRYDLADLKFKEKKYDAARIAFLPVQDDADAVDTGDLVKYKIFLCDLFGQHEDAASKELYVFNQVAANPSYYYGNCAWAIAHNKPNEAKNWLDLAAKLYSPRKQKFYSASLEEVGYLPLPSPTAPSGH